MQASLTALNGMNSATDWLNRVGDNIANMQTVGFAQDQGTFADALTMQLYPSATDPANANRYTPPGWRGGTGVTTVGEGKSFAALTMQQTGGKTDFAIQGPGFFVVKGASGPLYTKAGNFTWSARPDGRFQLATPNGLPVMSSTGQPIIKPTNGSAISIGPKGQISFGNTKGQTLAVAEFSQPSSHLIAQGNNMFAAGPNAQALAPTSSQVRQGFLSYSNVDMPQQMSHMILAQNMYQLNAESLQLTGRMTSTAVSIQP